MEISCSVYRGFVLLLIFCFSLNVSGKYREEAFQKKIKVACVGNSITRGYGLANPDNDSYPSQLQKLLGENYNVQNFGHSGATLLGKGHRPYINTRDYKNALGFKADVIIIHLGLNDTDPRNWPNFREDFISDYMNLIQSFRENRESMPEIFICRMSPVFNRHPRFKSGTRDWFWQIQEAIDQVAKNCNTPIIDLHTPLYKRLDLFKDALHPDEEGAGIIAQTVYERITGDYGGLVLDPVFMNHMVFQQGVSHPVWGKANMGDTIVATLSGQVKTCIAGVNGDWKVLFEPVPAGGPYQLKVITGARQAMVIDDILVGELWICAGQSNMEFMLKQAADASAVINGSSNDNIRLLNMEGIVRPDDSVWGSTSLRHINQLNFFGGEWTRSIPEEASAFSAIGYYFGKKLSENLNVPVGLINISVGGAPAEAFIDRKSLEFNPNLVDVLYNWKQNDFIMEWCRIRAAKNLSLSNNPLQRHPFEPAYIYEAGVDMFRQFPVAGVIWYQGESNAHNAEHYINVFPVLVESWRQAFRQPDMPFYFAQLSGINRPSWPYFRDVQRRLAQLVTNTGMVVTSDLGDSLDVHPTRKLEVAERFASIALSNKYNVEGFHVGSPEITAAVQSNGNLVISFSGTEKLTTSDGNKIKELEVAGEDGVFNPVIALINGNQLIITKTEEAVKYVRYGWEPFSRGNLINENGWPVSTFHVELPFLKSFK